MCMYTLCIYICTICIIWYTALAPTAYQVSFIWRPCDVDRRDTYVLSYCMAHDAAVFENIWSTQAHATINVDFVLQMTERRNCHALAQQLWGSPWRNNGAAAKGVEWDSCGGVWEGAALMRPMSGCGTSQGYSKAGRINSYLAREGNNSEGNIINI